MKPKLKLETEVQYLKGVGPKLAAVLAKRGIHTIYDLLHYYPRAYEDRRSARNIRNLKAEDIVSLRANIVRVGSFNLGRSKRKIYDITISDESGQIHCKFFRVPYKGYFERFATHKQVRVIGKVINYRGRLEFHHPEIRDYDPEEELGDELIPIYQEIEGLSSSKIAKLIRLALEQVDFSIYPEVFPPGLLNENHLIRLNEALVQIHRPDPKLAEQFHQANSQAHMRLKFAEFFWLELYLAARQSGLKKESGIQILNQGVYEKKIISSLPFEMTQAQKNVLQQILQDLTAHHPMYRLVQGDVGCGKTLVAFLTAASVIESKLQACLMAPTEILAEQHFKNAKQTFANTSIRCALLTGKATTAERKKLLLELQSGKIDLLIGTHALLEDEVQFKNLALVIIDEQHRFGVEQRGILKAKGRAPHFLIMTATPIPRTLAMTVYGDLEVSVIDEMPPGRSPIQTRVVYEGKRPQVLDFLLQQIQKGRQAYIVYPLVEESEKIDLKNAIEEFEKLKQVFPQMNIGLLHGKMKSQEKEDIMQKFRAGEIQILVSTTVIEVGVDVANANIMIVEHAERFGLSQLHQLRGRVGRGSHKSFCILILGRAVSEEARARTQYMEQTSDGFKIAEFDLEMRGPGEFLGTKQSGLPGFKLASLVKDVGILQSARQAAFSIIKKDPQLALTENKFLREELLKSHGATALAGIA